MEYKLLEPNFELKPFEEMTRKEAQEYLKWFVSKSPERIQQLMDLFYKTNSTLLDYSEESLFSLWEWFTEQMEVVRKTKEEFDEEKAQRPEWMAKDLLDMKLSTRTLAIMVDVALYFAEVFIRNYPTVKWGLAKSKSKAYINYNIPVLVGFKLGKYDYEINPISVLHGQTIKFGLNGINDKNLLRDAYNSCKEKIRID